jgi:hypothetical protein
MNRLINGLAGQGQLLPNGAHFLGCMSIFGVYLMVDKKIQMLPRAQRVGTKVLPIVL